MSFVIRNGKLFLDTHERSPLCCVPFRGERFCLLESREAPGAATEPRRGFTMRLRGAVRFETAEAARAAHPDMLFPLVNGRGWKVVRVLTKVRA